jgi:hypothetical protein
MRSKIMSDQLLRFNARSKPGLAKKEFRKLFAMCRCGLVVTRRVFRRHVCAERISRVDETAQNAPDVIDLTSDTDNHSQSNFVDLTLDSDEKERYISRSTYCRTYKQCICQYIIIKCREYICPFEYSLNTIAAQIMPVQPKESLEIIFLQLDVSYLQFGTITCWFNCMKRLSECDL